MKIKSLLITLTFSFIGILASLAQGTTFTYQGRLNDSGTPANGTNYGMTFWLYDAGTNGTSLGSFNLASVTVSNGLFTVPLNFSNVFDGTPRWLEIAVQKNGGSFSTLTPRQPVTPAPYAIFATTASNALNAVSAANAVMAASATSAGSANTAINFSGALAGDVSGPQGATVVNVVGGQTALAIANGAGVANAATSVDTPAAVVRRDYNGNFSANTITLDGMLMMPYHSAEIYAGGSVFLVDTNYNLFAGLYAGQPQTAGIENVGLGASALQQINSGFGNIAIGFSALGSYTTTYLNTALGNQALVLATNGYENTAVGGYSMLQLQNGTGNTALGAEVLESLVNGNTNIAIGNYAGYNLTNGSGNIYIGHRGLTSETNVIRIGSGQTQTYLAGVLNGNGAGLTNLNAATLSGNLTLQQLPAVVLSNLETGVTLGGAFSGNGNGLTNLNAAALTGNLVSSNVQFTGLIRSGSETGTAEPPLPAGLVIRRINSTVQTSNSIVAIAHTQGNGTNIILARDGTSAGFVIQYPAAPGNLTIACMGMDNTGAQKNFYTTISNPGTAGIVQIYTNSQNIVHFECTFGITYIANNHLTQVTLSRYNTDYFWSGTLLSTYNQ